MPLLGGTSSPFDEIVEKATNETNTSENWALIVDINDRVSQGGGKTSKDALLSIKKRLNHRDPHVVMLALSLLDSCWCNCGLNFQKEVCTREFVGELRSKATGTKKSSASKMNDSTYASSQEEAEAIAKAIQLSLKEEGGKSAKQGGGLYPGGVSEARPKRMVKALYDFEAAEDNELTFKAGELITVLDDTDINWWKGSNHRGEGLFPASFATADLTTTVEPTTTTGAATESKKKVQFDDAVKVELVETEHQQEIPQIDEEKLNSCMQLLQDADPTGVRPDPPELISLEAACGAMGPLIDRELEETDRQHNLLAEVDVRLRDALALYNNAMTDVSAHFQAQMQAAAAAAAQGVLPQMQMPPGYYQQPPPAQSAPAPYQQPQQMTQPYQQQGTPAQQGYAQQQPQYAAAGQQQSLGVTNYAQPGFSTTPTHQQAYAYHQ